VGNQFIKVQARQIGMDSSGHRWMELIEEWWESERFKAGIGWRGIRNWILIGRWMSSHKKANKFGSPRIIFYADTASDVSQNLDPISTACLCPPCGIMQPLHKITQMSTATL